MQSGLGGGGVPRYPPDLYKEDDIRSETLVLEDNFGGAVEGIQSIYFLASGIQ